MTAEASTRDVLPAELTMGTVMLKVGDMNSMVDYYQRALGLEIVAEQDGGLYLGRLQKPLVHLAPAPGLGLPSRGEAGLFHTALLFQDQSSLAATVASAARYEPKSFAGSADHLVSEAFYFTDPEGNGIELYWDRPREEWAWDGKNVVMDSLSLPLQPYLEHHLTEDRLHERALGGQRGAEAAVGHVHLQVGDVRSAQDFYVGTLGFEKTADLPGQALFVSAGGYHHHMAMNVWNSRGAGPRRDTLGLGEVLIDSARCSSNCRPVTTSGPSPTVSGPPVSPPTTQGPNFASKTPGGTASAWRSVDGGRGRRRDIWHFPHFAR